MRRVHLFELEDQPWFPKSIRDAGTDLLRFVAEVAKPYRSVVPRPRKALIATGSQSIVDLCSGGAGPIVAIQKELAGSGCEILVTMTDKFPNRAAFELARRRSAGKVDFVDTPVDAAAVPPNLGGFRTLFTSLHHFRPEEAKRILQDAVDQRRPIGVFEMTGRSLLPILAIPMLPLALLASTPFIRPLRWSRFLWTYLIPIVPLFITWDAFVSCLRTYSVKELQELVDGLDCEGYSWEIGVDAARPAPVTYLIGYPG